MIAETERTFLCELTECDFGNLCTILQDEKAMYAYEHAFSEGEVREWLERQIERYRIYGFGLWAVKDKKSGEFLGQCGITMQKWDDALVTEIGYLFRRKFWHRGYATECAAACKRYAFEKLDFPAVYSIIRENNLPSIAVAVRNGMVPVGKQTKYYYGMVMPHIVYEVKR